jgi:heme/copper-type cytochrome/quinol oxidase subunit 4
MSHFGDPARTGMAPGGEAGLTNDLIGLAVSLTGVPYFISGTTLVWRPGIPVALVVLAIALMGVRQAFFSHIATGPDNDDNVMALTFAVLIAPLIIAGSPSILAHPNHDMMSIDPRTRH